MKKAQLILVLLLTAALLFACMETSDKDPAINNNDNSLVVITNNENTPETYQSKPDPLDYEMVGEVLEIESGKVHLLTGDIVQIFEVSQDSLDQVYLNETVGILKAEGDVFEVVPYIIEDFTVRYTGMGLKIETLSGEIIKIESEEDYVSLTVETEDETFVSDYYGELSSEEGSQVLIDLVDQGENKFIAEVYSTDNILEITIDKISRSDEGLMTLLASDDEMKYSLSMNHETRNFNLSELKLGDTLRVYPTALLESYPVQIETNRVEKVF
jgi:hypothetical protein